MCWVRVGDHYHDYGERARDCCDGNHDYGEHVHNYGVYVCNQDYGDHGFTYGERVRDGTDTAKITVNTIVNMVGVIMIIKRTFIHAVINEMVFVIVVTLSTLMVSMLIFRAGLRVIVEIRISIYWMLLMRWATQS